MKRCIGYLLAVIMTVMLHGSLVMQTADIAPDRTASATETGYFFLQAPTLLQQAFQNIYGQFASLRGYIDLTDCVQVPADKSVRLPHEPAYCVKEHPGNTVSLLSSSSVPYWPTSPSAYYIYGLRKIIR